MLMADRSPLRFLLAVAMVAAFSSCASPAKPPNVILVVVDTLRADHLGCYGYERNTSPRIDAFADGATLYSRAMASAPWTVPSHASMFTGLDPFEHGAHTCKLESPEECVVPLAERFTTLAEVLQVRGYATTGFVANAAYMQADFRLNQGFDEWNVGYARAPRVTELALEFVETHQDGPFFLFLNYMDTHRVYNTRPRPGLLDEPAVQDGGELLDALIEAVLPGTGEVPAVLVQQVVDQYDTAIANADASLGDLFDGLRKAGRFDDSVVVVTSDHGEYLGEHRLVEHSKDIYQQAQWVPLIVRSPGQRDGRRVDTVASSTDLPHLVLSEFPENMRTELLPLFPNAPGNHVVISENYYTRANDLFDERWGHRFDRVRAAIYDWPYKYIRSSDGRHELYELAEDPGETTNLAPGNESLAQRLSHDLATFQSSRIEAGEGEPAELDEELREQLRSLGYLN
jgi:arylsulfatase A-like enzyme